MEKKDLDEIKKPIFEAPPEIQQVIKRVLEVERDNLYLDKPRIIDDIVNIIKEEIK